MQSMNPDLKVERDQAYFNTEKLCCVIWGDMNKVKKRRKIAEYVKNNKSLHPSKPHALMTRLEHLESVSKLTAETAKHAKFVIDETNSEEMHLFNIFVMGIDGYPLSLQNVISVPIVKYCCTDEQLKEWLPKMLNREINVAFAQTELGHGSNLNKLETRADYDDDQESFILNTPTLTATKYWPGNLGKTATHAIITANLFTSFGKKKNGIHFFMVQIRDLDTHLPLPGITVGDIGPNFGFESNENGFLQLKNVKIPRKNMLGKFSQVTKEGKYICQKNIKSIYPAAYYVRSSILTSFALNLAQSCTIAIRYSCVRRQGEIELGKGEVKILDYQTQQHRLFPQLAKTFAFLFAGVYTQNNCLSMIKNFNEQNAVLLPDFHALTCGLKAQISYQVSKGIEQCRMSCGGHGFSKASGFPVLYTTAVGGCTYEGENIVMLLQLAKFLLKIAKNKYNSKQKTFKLSDFSTYFYNELNNLINKDWLNVENYLNVFKSVSQSLTFNVYKRMIDSVKALNISLEQAWTRCSVDWTIAAKAHIRTFLTEIFIRNVKIVEDKNVKKILAELLFLYVTHEFIECSSNLLEFNLINKSDITQVRENYYKCLQRIRPQAVAIVDSFEFDDHELNSVLGRKDGNVYENLLKWSKSAPLNQTLIPEFHIKNLGAEMKRFRTSKL